MKRILIWLTFALLTVLAMNLGGVAAIIILHMKGY